MAHRKTDRTDNGVPYATMPRPGREPDEGRLHFGRRGWQIGLRVTLGEFQQLNRACGQLRITRRQLIETAMLMLLDKAKTDAFSALREAVLSWPTPKKCCWTVKWTTRW